MNNLQQFIAKTEATKFKVANDKISQIERNALKVEFMQVVEQLFKDSGIELFQTKEGLVLQIENDEQNIYIQLDSAIKNLDFDLSGAIDDYNATIQERETRKKTLAEKKEKALIEKAKSKTK